MAELLTESSPLPLLQFASGLIEATTPNPADGISGRGDPSPTAHELFASFGESGFPELIHLAKAGEVLHPGLLPGRRLDPLDNSPRWMAHIGDAQPNEAWLHQHTLGDGENVLIGWQWPDGSAATLVAYIDHNMGTLVKDAFVVEESIGSLQATYERLLEPGMTVGPLDLADARARLDEALGTYGQTLDVPETETWPISRPLVQWISRLLPTGGTGYRRPDWPEDERQRLLDDFTRSPFGKIPGLTTTQVTQLADPLVWFGCDYGPGDPLRWSPVAVEIVLVDWYPRKVLGLTATEYSRVADVLAGLVRYSHDVRDIPPDLTAETLDAIAYWRDENPDTNVDATHPILDLDDPAALATIVDDLEVNLIDLAGGPDSYNTLNADPLEDVPFDWSAIQEDARSQTSETLRRLDTWAVELFDPEVQTIARAVLAAVVTTDRSTFKRSSDTDGLAAAILGYVSRRITDRQPGQTRPDLSWKVDNLKALADATGVAYGKVTGRRTTVANVVDRSLIDWPKNLHSSQRLEILATKQQIAEWRATRT